MQRMVPFKNEIRIEKIEIRIEKVKLCFLVRYRYRTISLRDVLFQIVTLEAQAIVDISGDTEITIANFDTLPPAYCPPDYEVNLEHLQQMNESIILGDVNTPHTS